MTLTITQRSIAAFLIFAASLGLLMLGSRTQGNVRDEGTYFDAAELYSNWYAELYDNILAGHAQKSFTQASVDRWFADNHEHPALMKTLFGLSWRALHKCHCPQQQGLHPQPGKKHHTLELLDEEAAFRLPTHILLALLCSLVVWWGAEECAALAGFVAAALTLFSSRLFFDAQLATFDAPVAATWTFAVYGYWRGLSEPNWRARAGLLFGLALATKHNGFFIPAILILHWLWVAVHERRAKRPLPSIKVFLWMAGLGLPLYFATWPWLWFDTYHRFMEYVSFHVNHVYYNMEYLGVNYNKPPFPVGFPYVMTLLTMPVTTLVLAASGATLALRAWWKSSTLQAADDRGLGFLWTLNAIYPLAILTITHAPIFGATKHWHAAIPFIALFAGYAVSQLADALSQSNWMALALGLAVTAPAAAQTWVSHPYGLSDYNALAGGPAGGADLGMNRQFWGYATRGVLPWIDAHAAPRARFIGTIPNQIAAQYSLYAAGLYARRDLLNTQLEEPGVRASNIALVIHEKHFNKYEYWIWDFYDTIQPQLVLDLDGVPLVTVYQRPIR